MKVADVQMAEKADNHIFPEAMMISNHIFKTSLIYGKKEIIVANDLLVDLKNFVSHISMKMFPL